MKKLTDAKYMYFLLILSWSVYFVGYIARLNYGALIVEITHAEGISNASAGLVTTGASLTYAVGQIISGFLGDRFSPRYVMFAGLFSTAACNILMPFAPNATIQLIIWCINGFAQAMLWPPMLRIFTEYYREKDLSKMYVRVSTSTTAGTIFVYLLSSLCIAVSGWRTVFYLSSATGFAVAVLWLYGMNRIEKHREKYGVEEINTTSVSGNDRPSISMKELGKAGIFFIALALVFHGVLKDSVTTWMPTLIRDTYKIGSAVSILSTVVMPILGTICLYFASFVNNRFFRNDVVTATVFFAFSFLGALGIRIFTGISPALSVFFGAVITATMHGANLMLITAVPSHFVKFGKVSTLTGVLNAFTYAGSAISTYGIGALSETFGWNASLYAWILSAAMGTIFCVISIRPWKHFVTNK